MRNERLACRRLFQAASLALGLLLCDGAVSAQEESRVADVNLPYAYYYGIGSFKVGEDRVRLLRLSGRPTLKPSEEGSVGWALRLGASAAVLEPGPMSEETVESLSGFFFVPGIEAQIPVGKRGLLRPFVDLGFFKELDGGPTALIATTGIESEFVFPAQRFELALEPRLVYSYSASSDPLYDDDFLAALLKLDARHPLWFTIAGARADAGVYVEVSGFWGDVDFGAAASRVQEIDRQLEFGVSLGTNPRPKIWIFRMPRLTVGFRVGNEFQGFRIRFGDRTTRLPSQ